MGNSQRSMPFADFLGKTDENFASFTAPIATQDGSSCCLAFARSPAQKKLSVYDFVLRNAQIQHIFQDQPGWFLQVQNPAAWKRFREPGSVKVGIVGTYNAGKTTLTNALSGRKVPVSCLLHTDGLSAILTKDIVFMDTIGHGQPGAGLLNGKGSDDVKGSLLSEEFSADMVFALSDILIVVVNQLTREDQRYLKVMGENIQEAAKKTGGKHMIVVHNLKEVTTMKDMNELIDKDIVKACGCTPKVLDGLSYWVSASNVVHVVTALDGSPAGAAQNASTYAFLQKFMQGQLTVAKEGQGLMHGINDYVQNNIFHFFQEKKRGDWTLWSSKTGDGLRLFVNRDRMNVLQKNGVLSEHRAHWDKEDFKLDYELFQCSADASSPKSPGTDVMNVDVPGILPANADFAPREEKKTMQLHKYSWGEGTEVLLTATIRLLKKSGKGPSVEVWARRRRDEKNEKNVCLHDSGKHGEVNLKVDLDRFCEMYSDATVSMGPNGVLKVKMVRAADDAES